MPLHRRLPKHGFTNVFKKEWQVVNVSDLARCEPGEVTGETLKAAGLIKKLDIPIGSGYPADIVTRNFLKNWIKTFGELPPYTRKSWKTARKLLNVKQ